jgi:hypothetical protein
MKQTVYAVTTTAVKVRAANAEQATIYLRPQGNDTYVGGSDVTTSTGLKLTNADIQEMVIPNQEELWAIVATGTHNLVVIEPVN